MVHPVTAALLVSGASASRIAHHNQLNRTSHPIPTPTGFTFNWDMVYSCYAAGTDANVPAGYKVNKGEECPGKTLKTWADGTNSNYGDKSFTDVISCARECNEHEECAGFDSWEGVCSYWKSGELQDQTGDNSPTHDCYVQWEVRDLAGAKPIPATAFAKPGSIKPKGEQVSDCLCVWDIDRTLTAKQGWLDQCPGTTDYPNITDYAYTGGTMILSNLAANMRESFCGKCYFAAVSAGTASGPASANRELIDGLVEPKYNIGDWVDGCPQPVWGTKVMCCDEGEAKSNAVGDILKWLDTNGVHIEGDKVHFFDDKRNNIEGFEGTPYNAHMVSCDSRDGSRGGCGGVKEEVIDTIGRTYC